ncbi:hypothetical protein ABHF33_14180 [Chitinibacter sp. FCG-7]|uniref:Uncharacterized protein n=1 Tax=Chitinibacter mangrovi TaxID=3153927 RepID=A0AAU7F8E9_9NEIS
MIAGSSDPGKNTLSTTALTTRDLDNHANYSASSLGLGSSLGVKDPNASENTALLKVENGLKASMSVAPMQMAIQFFGEK